METPKVIFFDAVGTLFGVRGSVGSSYAKIALRYGVEVPSQTLDAAFFPAFKQAGSPAFPNVSPSEIPVLEYDWWKQVVRTTFDGARILPQFEDFDRFFSELFTHFATAEPWELYPDTVATLKQMHDRGIPLGILSNFDSRIYAVLRSLNLAQYFQSVTISTEVGAAKPDPKIFQVALGKHVCRPEEAWHVGDSLEEDYRAAKAVGLRGIWLSRRRS
ncbi:HAD family hydrolase [Alkalinema sp. FACHB-956]|uniref:HAD-IA family hydrolase n=1 Tax=Alkalinema sp. FACHB-956 TaxID=2692768 RepID=UPI0016870689|nr:HAD family hydrolase [Alkalinema sp. FACHB-956]MBD2326758.1 HAD family hydrolase [Alkalinema sp. FACHB-956]